MNAIVVVVVMVVVVENLSDSQVVGKLIKKKRINS
jgi:hypothetical protein